MAPAFGQSPPPHARQRGLQRFLDAARTRRRLRKIFPPQTEGMPWWRWAPAGVAAVVVIGAMSFLSASLMTEEGRRLDDPISIRSYIPTPERTAPPASVPSPLERVQEQVVVLEEAVRQGETVEVEFLGELEEASSELAQSLGDPGEVELVDRMAAVSAASKEYELLQTVQEQSSGFEARVLEASLAAAEDVLEKLGATPEPEPTTSPEPTSSPAATPSAVPSLTPTADAQATPSPLPTQAPVD